MSHLEEEREFYRTRAKRIISENRQVRQDRGPGYVPPREEPRPRALKESTQRRMESLLEKERLKARLDRVSKSLVQKFSRKYGKKYEKVVHFFVEEFVQSQQEEISDLDLEKLDREIKAAILCATGVSVASASPTASGSSTEAETTDTNPATT